MNIIRTPIKIRVPIKLPTTLYGNPKTDHAPSVSGINEIIRTPIKLPKGVSVYYNTPVVGIIRIPIKIRVPIKLPIGVSVSIYGYPDKLTNQNKTTKQEKQTNPDKPANTSKPANPAKPAVVRTPIYLFKMSEIKDVLSYYEMKVRQAMNTSGYKYLPRNELERRRGRKYGQLIALLKFITYKKVNYRLYIDSQFERTPNWKHTQLYPYLEQMYSPAAWVCYERYMARFPSKPTPKFFFNEEQEVIEAVTRDCEFILEYSQYPSLKHLTLEQRELKFIAEHSTMLSKYFWASIYWAADWLQNFEDLTYKKLLEQVKEIQMSKMRLERIIKLVLKIKRKTGVPFIESDWKERSED